MDGWKTTFLLEWPIFRGYVSFREGNSHLEAICFHRWFVFILDLKTSANLPKLVTFHGYHSSHELCHPLPSMAFSASFSPFLPTGPLRYQDAKAMFEVKSLFDPRVNEELRGSDRVDRLAVGFWAKGIWLSQIANGKSIYHSIRLPADIYVIWVHIIYIYICFSCIHAHTIFAMFVVFL